MNSPRAAYKHFLPLQTRWADNDIYGHVNNVAYYGYFDTIVNEYLIAAGALDIHATMAVYTQIGLISIGVSVFILVLTPLLNKGMHGVK